MTEEEAHSKWCPFSRVVWATQEPEGNGWRTTNSHAFNRARISKTTDETSVGTCIASECMAWRATDNYVGPSAPGEPDPPSQPAGFCGLAGAPR